jgi:hypothetical protein
MVNVKVRVARLAGASEELRMPPAIIAAAIATTGSLLVSNNASKAAKSAANTEYQATQDNIAENRRQFDAIQANNAPFRDVGVSAIGALGSSFGLPGYGPAPSMTNRPVASTPVPNAGGLLMTQGQYTDRGTGVGTQAIYPDKTGMVRDPASVGPTHGGTGERRGSGRGGRLHTSANPDVAAWIQQGHGDPSLGPNQTPEQAAAYHYAQQRPSRGQGVARRRRDGRRAGAAGPRRRPATTTRRPPAAT